MNVLTAAGTEVTPLSRTGGLGEVLMFRMRFPSVPSHVTRAVEFESVPCFRVEAGTATDDGSRISEDIMIVRGQVNRKTQWKRRRLWQ